MGIGSAFMDWKGRYEPDLKEMQKYLGHIFDAYRKAVHRPNRVNDDESLDSSMDSFEVDIRNGNISGLSTLDHLLGILATETTHFSEETYFAHMLSQSPKLLMLSHMIGIINSGNHVAAEVSRLSNNLERRIGRKIDDMVGYTTKSALSLVVSGGTEANMMALLVARNTAYQEFDLRKNGGIGNEKINQKPAVILPASAHYSLDKSQNLLGLGEVNQVYVRVNDRCQMDLDDLQNKLMQVYKENRRIVAVVGIAGNTETGAIDDLRGINRIVRQFERETGKKVWLHADAAWGGPYIFMLDEFKEKFGKALKWYDSVSIDPHKNFYTPYNAGVISFKNGINARRQLSTDAKYLKGHIKHPGGVKLIGSQSTSGIFSTYMALFAYPEEFYKEVFRTCLARTSYFVEQLKKVKLNSGRIEVVVENPEMNLVNFRYIPAELDKPSSSKERALQKGENTPYLSRVNRLNEAIGSYINSEGRYTISDTSGLAKSGLYCHRVVLMNPLTKRENIDGFVEVYKKAIEHVMSQRRQ